MTSETMRLNTLSPAPGSRKGAMSTTWISFARTGDPNNNNIPNWNPYNTETRHTMIFNPDCRAEQDFGKLERKIWRAFYYE